MTTGRLARRVCLILGTAALVTALWGCPSSPDARRHVVVYCAVDETFARTIFDRFEAASGIAVEAVFDSEAGKTSGLVSRIRAEMGRPRADVFFSGELFQTMRLAGEGALEAYSPPTAADIPPRFRDAGGLWTGIGLRGRVLCWDGRKMSAAEAPSAWEQLADPAVAARLAFGNPLFGTTSAHVSAMFAAWGETRGRGFLTRLREGGATMVDGNSAAVRAVIDGRATCCMTDTDDVRVARKSAPYLEQRFLDMGDGGALLIPSSVALVRGGPNAEQARRLIDFLVSADVERMLAQSESGNLPVRESLRRELGIELPAESSVSYEAVADAQEAAMTAVREILIR